MCALDTSLPMKVKEVDIQIPITNEAILRQWAAMWVAFTRAPLDDPHFPLSMKKPVDYGLIPLPMSETPTKDKDLFMGNLFMEQYKWLTLLEARYRPPYMRWLGAGVTATMDIPSGSYLCSYRGFHSSDEEEVERYSRIH